MTKSLKREGPLTKLATLLTLRLKMKQKLSLKMEKRLRRKER